MPVIIERKLFPHGGSKGLTIPKGWQGEEVFIALDNVVVMMPKNLPEKKSYEEIKKDAMELMEALLESGLVQHKVVKGGKKKKEAV